MHAQPRAEESLQMSSAQAKTPARNSLCICAVAQLIPPVYVPISILNQPNKGALFFHGHWASEYEPQSQTTEEEG